MAHQPTQAILAFDPDWVRDPVEFRIPDWIVNQFDDKARAQVAIIQLEHQQTVLQSQLKTNQMVTGMIREMANLPIRDIK